MRCQVEVVVGVLKAEQDRRRAGLAVRRLAWKNLVFTGPAGSGKSRTAMAVGQAYRELGVLSDGRVQQTAAADLAGTGPEETGKLVAEAAEYRLTLKDDLAVILAGEVEPLSRLLRGLPPLEARFRAVIDFPGYTPRQLAAIFVTLADEAGLRLTSRARAKAAAVLARAGSGHVPGSARLAVALLNQATAAQARRLAAWSSRDQTAVALSTISELDIPDRLPVGAVLPGGDWPGQYL